MHWLSAKMRLDSPHLPFIANGMIELVLSVLQLRIFSSFMYAQQKSVGTDARAIAIAPHKCRLLQKLINDNVILDC